MSHTDRLATPLVIGIGNSMRGDDGVGPAAVDRLSAQDLTDVELLTLDGEPSRLLDAWRDRELVIMIDTIVAGGVPGSLHRLEIGVDRLPKPVAAMSSHRAGLADAVALGRALGREPRRLIVHGIEPADVNLGSALSAPVSAALVSLVDRVLADIGARQESSDGRRYTSWG